MRKLFFTLAVFVLATLSMNAQIIGGQIPQIYAGASYSFARSFEQKATADKAAAVYNIDPYFLVDAGYEGKYVGISAMYGRSSVHYISDQEMIDFTANVFSIGAGMQISMSGDRFGLDAQVPALGVEFRQSPQMGFEANMIFYLKVRIHYFITPKLAIYARGLFTSSDFYKMVQPGIGLSYML